MVIKCVCVFGGVKYFRNFEMISSKFIRLINKSSYVYNNSQQKFRISAIHRICFNRMATNVYVSQRTEKENFQDTLPTVIDSLTSSPVFTEVPEVASWIKKVLEYNLAGGKKNRGLTTVIAYEMLERPENITEESLRLARILGWCVEMLQAYFLVADDIMDGSSTRRGAPCWYRQPEVGLGAINDSILIYSAMFHILKLHFGHLPQYAHILDLFGETILYTSSGQHLDYTMAHRSKNDYSLFTIERYNAIVKYKTAYYSYKLPVCLGLLLAHRTAKQTHEKAEEISLEIGKLFQMQDDFIDCYSDESVSGKAGTDIQEGKCSWLAVVALQRCNAAQRAIFEESYGSPDPEKVQRIKQLYDELQLRRIYEEWERAKYEDVVAKTQAMSREESLSPELFLKLVDMIYNRRK